MRTVDAVAAVAALLTGLAYSGLAALTAYELLSSRRKRGYSHLGGAFLMMALTCGPHHLVHAVHIALEGERVSLPLLVALLVGTVPGVTFVALRLEVLAGGRGDRHLAGSPPWLLALPWAFVLVAGGVGVAALAHGTDTGLHPLSLGANAVLLLAYTTVGILILRTQLLRRGARGGWSLSGIALGAVFPTCGLSHFAAGATTVPELHTYMFDLPGVPVSIYFLWVVHRLHRDALRDWNRRPLVGQAGATSRRSPWASPA